MSCNWASIVKSNNSKNNTKILVIKYNIDSISNENNEKKTDIPRQREHTPHPADDFTMTNGEINNDTQKIEHDDWANWDENWLDYTKDKHLNIFKKTLPLSIQRIAEFANKLKGKGIVIDLDFDEIEQDLKYQYQKNNGNKQKLKKLYFNYNPFNYQKYNPFNYLQYKHIYDSTFNYQNTSDYDKRFTMLFGDGSTLIHYLFAQMHFSKSYVSHTAHKISTKNKIKVIKQFLRMLKLLIINDIIDIEDIYCVGTFGTTIWGEIKKLTIQLNDKEYSKDIIDDIVDLIISCIDHKQFDKKEAILRIIITKVEYDINDPRRPRHWHDSIKCINLIETDNRNGQNYTQMSNKYDVIDKLLFRGMLPFQFCQELVKYNYNSQTNERIREQSMVFKQPIDIKGSNSTYEYIMSLLEKEKIFKNTLSEKALADVQQNHRYHDDEQPLSQMAILSPLILIPHFVRAKNRMNRLLIDCMMNYKYIESEYVSNEISNIISCYLFVNYQFFYDKNIEDNLNVKAISFLNNLLHLEINEEFMNRLKQKWSDKEFLHYLVGNYLYTLMRLPRNINLEFLCNFIKIYNKYGDDMHFPLEPNGIYRVLHLMVRNTEIKKNNYNDLIEFIKYIKDFYKETFDMNATMDLIIPDIVKAIWDRGNVEALLKGVGFILTEFKHEYDRNDPCLLYFSFQFRNLAVFKYLVDKYDEYSLEKICETMMKMINDAMDETNGILRWDHSWTKWSAQSNIFNREFLEGIHGYCLTSKCENSKHEELLNESIKKTWKCYGKVLNKNERKWI